MRVGAHVFMGLWVLGVASACGAARATPERTAEPLSFVPRVSSDEQRAAEALDRFVAACREGDLATAASGIMDRDLPSSEFHRAMDVDEPGRREAMQRVCDRVNGMLRGGEYERVGYRKEGESEGRWHLCTVRYAESGEQEVYAFMEIQGELLLGDIDQVR